jgi:large subunit ribosomal protein L1
MPKLAKRTADARSKVDRDTFYEPREAVHLVKECATAKFDETVELHLRTGLDGRHADQQLRGSVVLPHGLGKKVRVVVFADGDAAREAQAAGADIVGADDLIQRVQGGFTDFDVALAQRELMGKVGGLGRILGPRGLMPNPRNNTVVAGEDIGRAVREAKAGRAEFRLDRTNLIHCAIGKASFNDDQLFENLTAVVSEIVKNRPAGAKGQLLRGATLTSTMGPGVPLDVNQVQALGAGTA